MMEMTRLKKELKSRRLSDIGERGQLEERLEHALLKEDCAKTFMKDDGYAYGRVEVDVDEFLESKSNNELRKLLKEEHDVEKTDIPNKKDPKIAMLKDLMAESLKVQSDDAFEVVLRTRLRHLKVTSSSKETRHSMFLKLDQELSKSELNGATLWAFESASPVRERSEERTPCAAAMKYVSPSPRERRAKAKTNRQ